jgi:hypothetical protein
MYYIFRNDNDFGFKCSEIHEIIESDILISDEIYQQFFSLQCLGKLFRLKDINGTTFEEIFEEYQPDNDDSENKPLSEIDLLKQRIEELEALIASIKTVDNALLLDAGVVGSVQSTEND